MGTILPLILLCLCVQAASSAFAQTDGKIVLSPDRFRNASSTIDLVDNWKYHAGDHAEWADPTFDDSEKYTIEHQIDRVRRRAREQMFFTGMPLAFAILHLLLFLFYPLSFVTKESRVGVGMGLYNAYHIIEKHNGTIDVKSEVGAGTRFTIALPIDQTL